MFNIEKAIQSWLKEFRKHQAFEDGSIQEMEIHLRDSVEDLISEGYSEKEAFHKAAADFGDIQPLANEEFSTIKRAPSVKSRLHMAIMKSYFKVVFRSLLKSPLHSFINVFGLSTAIGIAIFVFAFAEWVYRTDQFHQNKEQVFLATYYADRSGEEKQFGQTPQALAKRLENDFSQISAVCRIEDRPAIVKRKDDVFRESIRLTDPEFFEMFTFPLKWGTASSLSDINSVIINEQMSKKYFGNDNPIGKELQLIFSEEVKKVFKVTGVAKKFPESRTIDYQFLINYENLRFIDSSFRTDDWGSLIAATFIKLDAQEIQAIKNEMKPYKELRNNAVDPERAIKAYDFVSLGKLHRQSDFIENDISSNYGGNYASVIYLSIVALMMIALACFNYINIAIVSAAKRLKEIGLRKTIGATRKTVIWQFLSENLIMTGFALVFGLILATTIFIPGFENMFQFNMGFNFVNPKLIIFLIATVLLTSLMSGFYPSIYISKFEVVTIFKGKVKFGKKNPLTKLLLGIQLILACIFIASAVMFTQNSNYLAHRDWGYDPHGKLYARVDNYSAYEKLINEMAQHPGVQMIAGSEQHIGVENTTMFLRHEGAEHEVSHLGVNPEYLETMDLQLIAGRFFHSQEKSDQQAVVINETLERTLGLQDPIGQEVKMNDKNYLVIGVLQDFHHLNFQHEVLPTIFTTAKKEDLRFLTLKVNSKENTPIIFDELQQTWATLYPETPFNGGFQEDVWGYYFTEIRIHGIVWTVFACLAVIMAGLGLYGLISLNIEGRVKEFSIKKVLGAGSVNIIKSIIRQYSFLFMISLLLGIPLGYYLIKTLIQFAYRVHMPIGYGGIYLTAIFIVSILIVTFFLQIYRVIQMNAVKGLKVE